MAYQYAARCHDLLNDNPSFLPLYKGVVNAFATWFVAAYPNGGAERYYTPELQRVVREAGYTAATTSFNGFAGPNSDLYALERVQVAERLDDLVFALEVERFAFKPVPRERRRGA